MARPAGKRPFVVRNLTSGTVLADNVREGTSFWDLFRGLMLASSLGPGEALWLAPASSIHMFFMRFAIDAVFLGRPDADGSYRVVAVRPHLPPWRGIVWWVRGGHGVLELAAGTADSTSTRVGDRLVFEDRP